MGISKFFVMAVIAGMVGSAQAAPPNIVYILADDMGPGDVSAYNTAGKIPTPHIDRIAQEGVRFTDAHSNASICTPTRYGTMTGRYTWRTPRKEGVVGGYTPLMIQPGRMTVSLFLKEQGYRTACVGKWHMGLDWALKPGAKGMKGKKIPGKFVDLTRPITRGPLDVGFDYFFGLTGSMNMFPYAFIDGRNLQGTLEYLPDMDAVNARGFEGAKPGWGAKEFDREKTLGILTKKACSWIRQNAEKPFFLYFPLTSPHSPIVPSENFKGKSGLNGHGDYVLETDWAVGQVLKTLDELNLAENTLVVFTSDNGTSPQAGLKTMQAKGHFTEMQYRGLKGTTWEGGHRVPFVVRWPAGAKRGIVSEQLICSTDLLATCNALLGKTLPADAGEDSVSFLPALKGEKIPGNSSRMIVHHSDKGFFAVRKGKWKLLLDDRGGSSRKNPKDQPVVNAEEILLFDMELDEEESTNLSRQYPEVVMQMKKELASLIRTGRSTPGAAQPTDYADPSVKWKQLAPIREYLK
ncbi:sulfatase family protein [Pontiella agarivorans]|uniref:Arylsulfatase n=1 Tax=Pontiella agarivorans TaxID=3038953 RepID=A0ABU5MS96_9BACT|nr:arylsulfatase [Pontiella agarivorans]MDZ8117003.1 arylsulfatase [Pontiella agarivorans]